MNSAQAHHYQLYIDTHKAAIMEVAKEWEKEENYKCRLDIFFKAGLDFSYDILTVQTDSGIKQIDLKPTDRKDAAIYNRHLESYLKGENYLGYYNLEHRIKQITEVLNGKTAKQKEFILNRRIQVYEEAIEKLKTKKNAGSISSWEVDMYEAYMEYRSGEGIHYDAPFYREEFAAILRGRVIGGLIEYLHAEKERINSPDPSSEIQAQKMNNGLLIKNRLSPKSVRRAIDWFFSERVLKNESVETDKLLPGLESIDGVEYVYRSIETRNLEKLEEIANVKLEAFLSRHPDNSKEMFIEIETEKAIEYQSYFPEYKTNNQQKEYYFALVRWIKAVRSLANIYWYKGGQQVMPAWDFFKKSGMIDSLEKKGMPINPTHNFELLKEARQKLFEKEKQSSIEERNLNHLETTDLELNLFYLSWLYKELKTIISDKYPNGQPKKQRSNSDQIELLKYKAFVNTEIKTIEKLVAPLLNNFPPRQTETEDQSKTKKKTSNDRIPNVFEDLFNDPSCIGLCMDALKKSEPPVVDDNLSFNLGERQKGAVVAWMCVLKKRNKIKHIKDEILAGLLNGKIENLNLGKDGRTLRNTETTAYKKYFFQFLNLIS